MELGAKIRSRIEAAAVDRVTDDDAARWQHLEKEESEDEAPAKLEASKADGDTPASSPATDVYELYPDIQIEHTVDAVKQAKDKANSLFAQGEVSSGRHCELCYVWFKLRCCSSLFWSVSFAVRGITGRATVFFCTSQVNESVRWFSKCIWLITAGQVSGVPNDLHSILYSNRASAKITLESWADVEEDCSTALSLNGKAMCLSIENEEHVQVTCRQVDVGMLM